MNKRMIVVLGVLALLLVAFLALRGGSETAEAPMPAVAPVEAPASAAPAPADELRLVRFVQSKVTRFKVRTDTTTVHVAREGEQWVLIEPRPPPEGFVLDAAQTEALLAWLGALRATRVLEGAPTEAQLDARSPSVLIEIFREAAPPQTVLLGAPIPGSPDGAKELYARGALDARAYAVPEAVKTRLARGLELFTTSGSP
ncbi:hypothetical protein [Archangium primigenium]|uniref:hypothetical protein n=1 Tax=[Archangium] primigenium TaxID=2792470 RepID=UPI0019570436|nr:hypothetical protein [Archangium primigenium]MBM7117903.1 hypothetical protein [Archangium primigenium]